MGFCELLGCWQAFARRTTWKWGAEEGPGGFSRSVRLPSDGITSSYVISERCKPHLSARTSGVGVFTWQCRCLLTLIESFPSCLI